MDKYVVEVRSKANTDKRETAAKLAAVFKVDAPKVEGLLERLPDVVTKPVSEAEASAVAKRFRKAGLEALVRPAEGVASSAAPQENLAMKSSSSSEPSVRDEGPALAAREGRTQAQQAHRDSRAVPSKNDATTRQRATEADAEPIAASPNSGRLLRKLLALAIGPALLTLVGALVASWFTLSPMLHEHLALGADEQMVAAQLREILINIALFSLVPIGVALFLGYRRAAGLTRNVLYLTERADQISRGDLESEVRIFTRDELEDLAESLERLRVSMKEALDRLRRRRM